LLDHLGCMTRRMQRAEDNRYTIGPQIPYAEPLASR
jgi:hypothetical protein